MTSAVAKILAGSDEIIRQETGFNSIQNLAGIESLFKGTVSRDGRLLVLLIYTSGSFQLLETSKSQYE